MRIGRRCNPRSENPGRRPLIRFFDWGGSRSNIPFLQLLKAAKWFKRLAFPCIYFEFPSQVLVKPPSAAPKS